MSAIRLSGADETSSMHDERFAERHVSGREIAGVTEVVR